MTSIEARTALRKAILEKNVDLAKASRAIGHASAYLQQFIARGTPKYLHEQDRESLARLYGIDVEALRPPVQSALRDSASPRPRVGDPIQESREADIVYAWRQLSEEDKEIVTGVLDGLRARRGLPPIAA